MAALPCRLAKLARDLVDLEGAGVIRRVPAIAVQLDLLAVQRRAVAEEERAALEAAQPRHLDEDAALIRRARLRLDERVEPVGCVGPLKFHPGRSVVGGLGSCHDVLPSLDLLA